MVIVVFTGRGTAADVIELQRTTNEAASIANSSTAGNMHKGKVLNGYTMPLCFCEERKLVALFLSGGISLTSTVLCPFHTDTGHCSADVTEFEGRYVVQSDPSTVGILETRMQEGQMLHDITAYHACMLIFSCLKRGT